jgi:7-cyano-7-deazaguanine reductase
MKDTDSNKLTVLGRKVTKFGGFETFKRPENCTKVTCISDEVTANCPVTNQPDWYVVEIEYEPINLCVESKTLKLYLHSYRNKGLFCEAFASKIADDLFYALHPKGISVTVTQKPRGGVSIVAKAQRLGFSHSSNSSLKKD